MADKPLKVLLVEDNPGDARLVTKMLSDRGDGAFDIILAKRLEEALDMLDREAFDAVLLDLSLPDSSGVETIDQAKGHDSNSGTPIIVVTGRYGERDAMETMEHGAQDFLTKTNLDADVLIRSIRFAVERQRSRRRADDEESANRSAREIKSLEAMQAPTTTLVTARAYGFERLSEASADTFATLVEQYRELIEAAIEQRRFKIEGRVSQGLRVMAQRLGFLRASPRDVVDLHLAAVKSTRPLKMATSYVVAEEARLMLIELMGDLAAYYRDHMLPVGRGRNESRDEREEDEVGS